MKFLQGILFLLLLVFITPMMLVFAWITSFTEKADQKRKMSRKKEKPSPEKKHQKEEILN